MARKKKQSSNAIGYVLLALLAAGIFYSGILDKGAGTGTASSRPAQAVSTAPASSTTAPLSAPRFVNVASLNVRHTPSTSGPLIMALPRGTALKVLDRRNGWLLIDINPTLEGWVAESLTTTVAPSQPRQAQQSFVPPKALSASN